VARPSVVTSSPATSDFVPERGGPLRLTKRRRGRPPLVRNWALLLPALLFLGVFSIYPMVELVRMSVSEVNVGNLLDRVWPFTGTENYSAIFEDAAFGISVRNTVILVVVTVVVSIGGGLLAALFLQRETRFNAGVHGIMIFMWALPPLVTGSIWKFLLSTSGPVSGTIQGVTGAPPYLLADPNLAIWSVTAVVCWASVAFASLLMRAGLAQLDPHQTEAAMIDGANRLQLFRFLILPALRPVILVQALLVVLYSFKTFDFPFVLTNGGPGTASTTLPYLAYTQSFGSLEFGAGSATAVASMLVVIAIAAGYLFLSRDEASQ